MLYEVITNKYPSWKWRNYLKRKGGRGALGLQELKNKIIDKYTSAELVELIDLPIETLLELLWDAVEDGEFIDTMMEDMGEYIDDEE